MQFADHPGCTTTYRLCCAQYYSCVWTCTANDVIERGLQFNVKRFLKKHKKQFSRLRIWISSNSDVAFYLTSNLQHIWRIFYRTAAETFFLSEINNRETIAATEATNDTIVSKTNRKVSAENRKLEKYSTSNLCSGINFMWPKCFSHSGRFSHSCLNQFFSCACIQNNEINALYCTSAIDCLNLLSTLLQFYFLSSF